MNPNAAVRYAILVKILGAVSCLAGVCFFATAYSAGEAQCAILGACSTTSGLLQWKILSERQNRDVE